MTFQKGFSLPPSSAKGIKKRHKKFQKVGFGSFGSTLSKAGISKQVEATMGVNAAIDVLKERFGEGVEVHAKAKYIKNRILGIEVVHPAVSEQIAQEQENIIKAVNEKLGRPEIVDIQFLIDKNEQEFFN